MTSRKPAIDLAYPKIASENDIDPAVYPELYSLSPAFFYRFLPRPTRHQKPEMLYVPTSLSKSKSESTRNLELLGLMATWNVAWEAGQLRSQMIRENDPVAAELLKKFPSIENKNVYLVPNTRHRFEAYYPLYSILPARFLKSSGIPIFGRKLWPSSVSFPGDEDLLPLNFREQLSQVFAEYIWPFMESGSKRNAFSKNEPLRLLSHNLDFWLPHITEVIENRLKQGEYVKFENEADRQIFERIRESHSSSEYSVEKCRKGNHAWIGETDAREATAEIVDAADRNSQLRGLIDAIKSNRVEEDFSSRWSYAREDFERKLYSKRSRVRIKFVELDEARGVVGPHSEITDNLLSQDFFATLNLKEREIVVCISNGSTTLVEIAKKLGYANHSAVSKALSRIRLKARKLLDL